MIESNNMQMNGTVRFLVDEEIVISPSTTEALQAARFPKEEVLLIKFWKNPRYLIGADIKAPSMSLDDCRYLIIGKEDCANYVCLDLIAGDSVVGVDNYSGQSYLINSDLESFQACIWAYLACQQERNDRAAAGLLDEAKDKEIVTAFWETLLSIDAALRDAHAFWPVIVEQMENGLM